MATFNLDAFRSALGTGGARPNQFEVTLGFPRGAPNGLASYQGSFLVNAASLPGHTLPAVGGLSYRGRAVHVAGDRVFSPWQTTILNDTQFIVRNAIEQWMSMMEDLAGKFGQTAPEMYYADMTVKQLDRNGATQKSYLFKDAFPTELSEVGLSYDSNDTISVSSCTWTYSHFILTDAGGATFGAASIPGVSFNGVP